MINKWWFRLYTKDYLLALLKLTGTCVLVDQLMTNFAGGFKGLAVFLVTFPFVLLFMKNLGGSLRGNIEFHKMSVPFPELKAALFKDIAISILATFGSSLSIILLSVLFNGIYSSNIGDGLFRMINPGMMAFGATLALMNACYVLIINKDRKYLMIERSTSRVTNFINSAGISLLALLFFIVIVSLIPSSQVTMFIIPSSIFIGALLFHQKAIFNQYKPQGKLKDFAKFWAKGAMVCCSIYFLCLLISRHDVLNENLHGMQRASSFEFNSRYNPEIDFETFKAIERYVSWDSKRELYEGIAFNPSTLGLEYYLDNDKYALRLNQLLNYSKPTPEFLLTLYDHFEKKPEYWKEKKQFPQLQYMAFSKWPKNEVLPDKYIVAKQTSRELFKQEKENIKARAKARRELASQQEE